MADRLREFNGYGRNTGTLEKYIRNGRIAPKLVEIRADFARSEALRHFFACKAGGDFYFEDILNSFIALAQYPLNFAVFADHFGSPKRLAHFCSDKMHEERFEELLLDSDGEWNKNKENRFFRFFPDLLDEPKLFIAIYHMDTKSSEFMLVRPRMSVFPLWKEDEASFEPEEPTIGDAETYIASCADFFFQFKWDVFTSEFAKSAGRYLDQSITKLAVGHHSWQQRSESLRERLEETVFPDGGRDRWKALLESTFASVLLNSTSGINLVTDMMQKCPDGRKNRNDENAPPNMLLAFRAFSREPGECRHKEGMQQSGYLYDTSFLVSDGLKRYFVALLEKIRADGQAAMSTSGEIDEEVYEGPQRTKCLYRNVVGVGGENITNIRTLEVLDRDFWELLCSDDGAEKCVDILSSWVGSKIRSLVDPVYHTGLIHTNHLFQFGGIDRLGDLADIDINSIEDVPRNCHRDVRRVVIYYYVLCEILGWASDGSEFDPSNVAAVLIPIKMRGSVWGVTLHGVYTPNYETIFADQRYWQGYFKLATDHRQKNSQVFDRYLWDLAEELVSGLFVEHYLPQSSREIDIESALIDINFELECAERFSPFAFPEFYLARERQEDGNCVRVVPDSDIPYWICWRIRDNQFFTAHQVWDKRATRKFTQVVKHGIMSAINTHARQGPIIVQT